MTDIKRHPLESFPNAVQTVTLPMTGLEVVIRKLDVEAITNDAMRTVLSLPALQEVAADFAKLANEEGRKKVGAARSRGTISTEMALDIARETQRAVIRAGLIRPDLETLVGMYGGNYDTPDMGLGPDYSALATAIDDFSNPKAGEAEKEVARTFPLSPGGHAERAGDKVRAQAK